jgi:hypothetical protein
MPSAPCQPIRDDISALEQEIRDRQDLLDEVPPSLKPAIQGQIKRDKENLARLKRALKACENGR